MYEGFALLTGAPCELIRIGEHSAKSSLTQIDTIDFLWAQILSYRDAGFLMGASCCSKSEEVEGNVTAKRAAAEAMGLICNHAYSVIDVQITRHGLKMVRLRNPWGTREWCGDWSDDSKCWSNELRQELFAYKNDDGIFWMSFSDFIMYFTDLTVAKTRKDWVSVNCQGQVLHVPLNPAPSK